MGVNRIYNFHLEPVVAPESRPVGECPRQGCHRPFPCRPGDTEPIGVLLKFALNLLLTRAERISFGAIQHPDFRIC